MVRDYNVWSADEDARLLLLRDDQKLPFRDIDRDLGRSLESSSARYRTLRGLRKTDKKMGRRTERAIVEEATRQRHDASAREHVSLTAILLGDPLPGRSALDQKRMASP